MEAARSERYRRDHCCLLAGLACNARRMRRATGYKDNRGMREGPGRKTRSAIQRRASRWPCWVSLKLPGERVRRKERERAREGERRRERERLVNGPLRKPYRRER